MKSYDQMAMKEALPQFYLQYQIDEDGGINDTSVKVELLKGISVYIPNIEARKKVILKHDMHHVLTGYPGAMKGETEISAWEISTGCRHSWLALTLNYFGMLGGVLFNLKGVWMAYLRGKASRNLYKIEYTDEQLLNMNVSELRKKIGLTGTTYKMKGNIFTTLITFITMILLGIPASAVGVIIAPLLIIYSLYTYTTKKWEVA